MYGYDYPPAQKKHRFSKALVAIFTIAALLIVAVGFIIVLRLNTNSNWRVTDSGITACHQIADRQNNKSAPKMDFPAVRAQFQDSEYMDLQIAGTNLVDAVKSASESKDDSLAGSVSTYTEIQMSWSQLQVACENHGIDVPDLPKE